MQRVTVHGSLIGSSLNPHQTRILHQSTIAWGKSRKLHWYKNNVICSIDSVAAMMRWVSSQILIILRSVLDKNVALWLSEIRLYSHIFFPKAEEQVFGFFPPEISLEYLTVSKSGVFKKGRLKNTSAKCYRN